MWAQNAGEQMIHKKKKSKKKLNKNAWTKRAAVENKLDELLYRWNRERSSFSICRYTFQIKCEEQIKGGAWHDYDNRK